MFFKFSSKILTTVWYLIAFDFLSFDLTSTSLWSESHDTEEIYISIYIPWPFPPVWGIADNTKETTKTMGFHSVLPAMTRDPAEFGWHCWSNTAHPPPSSTTYVAS